MSFEWWPPDGPWPTSPGGIRGPDNRNLSDLHNLIAITNTALAAMALQIAGMATDISQLAADVRRLAGDPAATPANWTGLPPNWIQTIGPPIATAIDTMRPNLSRIYTSSLQTNQSLIFAGMPITAGGRVSQAVDMVINEAANRSTARFAIETLAAAVGSLGTAPADMTVKQLLEAIRVQALRTADCCEEGSETPPPSNPAPDPTLCEDNGTASQTRVETIIEYTSGQQNYVPGETTLSLFFGTPSDGVLIYDATASLEANAPVYLVEYEGDLDGCVEWDLTGDSNAPWTVQHRLVEQVGGVWQATITTAIGSTAGTQPGVGGFTRADGLRFAFFLSYTGGEDFPEPGRNFWLSYGANPS